MLISIHSLARLAIVTGILALCCCHENQADRTADQQTPTTQKSAQRPTIGGFDASYKPADDFYDYVNANWVKSHPIPPDQAAWGTFNELADRSQKDLKTIVEELQGEKDATSNRQKIRDFYATAMDAAKLNREGVAPLKGEFDRIATVSSAKDLVPVIAHMHMIGAGALFMPDVDADLKNSEINAMYINQAGTSLPERDYYLKDDAESKRVRDAYREHLTKMFALFGNVEAAAAANAETVLKIETQLAEKQMTPVQLRDPELQYNKMSVAKLAEIAPAIDWKQYFDAIGVGELQEVIVCQPEFIKRVSELVQTIPPDAWQTYLRWQLIRHAAPALSDAIVEEDFHFYGQVLGGAKELKPRWKRAVSTINRCMGEALGKLYVEKYFGAEAKQRINVLVDNIIAAFAERIRTRDWMGDETKAKALAKLKAIGRKLAYPDKWRDYSKLSIETDSYVANVFRSAEFEGHRQFAKVGKPVDRSEWQMTPPTVNAYYNPQMNEIVFPAAILQPPFFDAKRDDAYNYGGIGMVIGHELTHGFDDKGCKFDAKGNLANWWTPQDLERFKAKAAKLVEQYGACKPIDDLHINGELTLGENIADLGGLYISLDAYERSLGGKPAPEADGLSALQRFFVGYARVWASNMRPEMLKMRLRVDPHSPPRFRVQVPLSDMAAFYRAWGVKEGDAMWRAVDQRVEVW